MADKGVKKGKQAKIHQKQLGRTTFVKVLTNILLWLANEELTVLSSAQRAACTGCLVVSLKRNYIHMCGPIFMEIV